MLYSNVPVAGGQRTIQHLRLLKMERAYIFFPYLNLMLTMNDMIIYLLSFRMLEIRIR